MRLFGDGQLPKQKPERSKCPACDGWHDVLDPLPKLTVMICPIIPDLIYTKGVRATRQTRELVKDALFGH